MTKPQTKQYLRVKLRVINQLLKKFKIRQPASEGLLSGEIYSALKRKYITEGDGESSIRLSRAKENDVAAMLGRAVKAYDANMEVDPIRAIKELNKINEWITVKSKPETLNKAKDII